MVRRLRRRRAKGAKREPTAPKEQGFDYGAGFGTVLVGDMEFPSLLSKADVLGVAYGLRLDDEFNARLPYVSLIAASRKPIVEAFEHFGKWAEGTDGDAVDLCWVFLRDGGYLLGIAPEWRRLQHRCTGYSRHIAVSVVTAPTWIKRMDTCGPETQQFRRYGEVLAAPFLFGASECSLPRGDLPRASSSDIKHIPAIRPIRKLSATFVDEQNVVPNTEAWVALQTVVRDPNAFSKPAPPTPEEWFQDRGSALRAYFAVTLERIRALTSGMGTGELKVLGERYAPWQVEQAVCNVLLTSKRLGQPHYAGIHTKDLPGVIRKALEQHLEQADGHRDSVQSLSVTDIERQVGLDSRFLLLQAGLPAPADGASVQRALEDAGLAEPRISVTA